MQDYIKNKIYHVEILPPKQDSKKLEADIELFAEKYNRVMKSGYCACIADNAMGHLAFQGTEIIEELELNVNSEQVMIHLNTFHTKEDLHNILDTCKSKGIKDILVLSGDGSDQLPKLQPSDIRVNGVVESVTSVELLKYIKDEYPDTFVLGAAFNPYQVKENEFSKLQRKINAGASFIVTQPIIEKNAVVDELLEKYPDVPIIIEAWMSKNLQLLSEAVEYEIPQDIQFDPVETLKILHRIYPENVVRLSLLGFKTQYHIIEDI
ncbi:5,10-methylenetetrahydrofolate reductase [Gottschalkia acidurici 9a]|uniref:Methylenetetrahydrofolate reductase n=1 Tax=Gottschalkia acidurici (strain ATCC 7906 / DSM 604 / BCRC 14475 / CIP 104303 / KCTC 5404 / NCIMB 10678 / 9a) TaxID=1128398 RepID=K0B0U2_GOTA9|nr:methylenetetrahydrofolate reductase [Gottschalkia acidurici]AFS79139.1 5,10-methylenetetrahydrofolate reductase [Gottschalkia acidurici 9a]